MRSGQLVVAFSAMVVSLGDASFAVYDCADFFDDACV